jgi:patatin-like phospholipase/acyl hydrolase
VERQAAANPALQRKQQRFVSIDDRKKDVFTLQKVVGPPENPDSLVLRLADTGQEIQLSKDKPFRRVDGYTADLKYEFENARWSGQRIGNHLKFAGDDYTIVDINSDEVVLSARSNQKKWTLRYTR